MYFGTLKPELFYIPTIILKDENRGEDITQFVKSVGNRNGHCDDVTSDGNGNLYSGNLEKGCITKWSLSDPEERHNQDTFICNPDKLVWVNSLFWNDGYLYIVTNE